MHFKIEDIFKLTTKVKHESLFGGFIWSHIKLQDLNNFVNIANSLVEPGGTIVFMDNNYVENSSLPLSDSEDDGNTYQIRTLTNGTKHKVLKNFPTEEFIRQLLFAKAHDISFINLQYYWILKYTPV